MTRRRVTFLPGAQDDLREIAGYISERDGSRAALIFISEVEAYCFGFDIFSERGSVRQDGSRSIGFKRKVQIAFRVKEDRVEIAKIVYAGRRID